MTRRAALTGGLGLAMGALLLGHPAEAATANGSTPPWGYVNAVQSHGVVADGQYYGSPTPTTDNTGAIQAALDDVGMWGGGIVYLPAGVYFLSGTLTVPANTVLVGVQGHPWTCVPANATSKYGGTILLAVSGAGNENGAPFIQLGGMNAGVDGLSIYYPDQTPTNPPRPYPWTIRGNGDNNSIQNTFLVNSYNGIDLATHLCARHLVQGICGQPLHIGLQIDQCYDVGRVRSVHFWPFWSNDPDLRQYMAHNSYSFRFFRTDCEIVEDVFSLGYMVGASFAASKYGAPYGQFNTLNFDGVDIGLLFSDTNRNSVLISGLTVANSGRGDNRVAILGTPGHAFPVIRGASIWGGFKQAVSWQNSGYLSVADSRFMNWDPSLPAIEVLQGRALIHDNLFTDARSGGVAVRVASGVDRATITGNELIGNRLVIENRNTLYRVNDTYDLNHL